MRESSRQSVAGNLQRFWMFLLLDVCVSLGLTGRHLRGNGSSLVLLYDMLRGRVDSDSLFHMGRAWAVLHQGKPVYETLFFGEHIKFTYPTSSLLLFSVADVVHVSAAGLLLALIWVSVAGIIWLSGEILLAVVDREGAWGRLERLQLRVVAALLALFFYPVMSGVGLGQVQTLLTFLWMLAVWAWMRDRTADSGVCLGLICAFKPTLGVFLLWALLRRQWRFLWAFAGMMAAVQVLAVAFFGWHNAVEYLKVLSYLSHSGEAFLPNQTVNGFLERWTHNGDSIAYSFTVFPPCNRIVYLGTVMSSALLLGFGLLAPMVRRWKDGAADFILFGMLTTVASPVAWVHHYGYFLPGCLYLLGRMVRARGPLPVIGTVCFLVLTNAWPMLNGLCETRWNPVLSYDLYAGLGLLAVFVVWVERERRAAL